MADGALTRLILDELDKDPDLLEQLRARFERAAGERLLKTREAADLLGCAPRTLVKAANEGRVDGAHKIGENSWRYRASELKMHPPGPRHLGPAGNARRVRRPGPSSATAAILGGHRDPETRRAA